MLMTVAPDPLLQEAQAGNVASLGQLLERYRRYLVVLAQVEIGRRLQGKADASDLVQETFLEAHRNFARFRGNSSPEFTQWLRQILAATFANHLRRYLGTRSRDIRLECGLADAFEQSSAILDAGLVATQSSPSEQAVRREQSVLLGEALGALPPAYREVLILRHLEGLTFPEVAQRMARSVNSVQKLWLRGLTQLRHTMGGLHESEAS